MILHKMESVNRISYFQHCSRWIHLRNTFLTKTFTYRYLLGFENLLRQVDCRVTVPMWNWALHSEYAWETRPNYHMWDNFGGFGGNGSAPDFCVKYGHFAKGIWLTSGREDSAYIEKYTELQLEEYITSDQGKLSNNRTKYLNHEALRVRSEHNRVDGHINPWTRSASHNCLRRAFTCLPPSLKRVTDYILCLEPSEIKIVSAFNSLWHNKVHECLCKYEYHLFSIP